MAVPKRKQSPSRTGMRRAQTMKFKSTNIAYLVKYFENYRLNLKNNTLNSYIKGVVKH